MSTTTRPFRRSEFRDHLDNPGFERYADAYADLGMTAVEAAGWANRGFTPAGAERWLDAGFQHGQYFTAASWADNGYGPASAAAHEAGMARDEQIAQNAMTVDALVEKTAELLVDAVIAEAEAPARAAQAYARQQSAQQAYQDNPDGTQPGQDAARWPGHEPDRDAYLDSVPTPYSGNSLEFTGDLDSVQAVLVSSLPAPPTQLSPEAEEIARGVEQREAEFDAMEADPDMVGSEAWAERQYDEMAERGDAFDGDDRGVQPPEHDEWADWDDAERRAHEADQEHEYEAEQAAQGEEAADDWPWEAARAEDAEQDEWADRDPLTVDEGLTDEERGWAESDPKGWAASQQIAADQEAAERAEAAADDQAAQEAAEQAEAEAEQAADDADCMDTCDEAF